MQEIGHAPGASTASASRPDSPLVMRWMNSISVSICAGQGMIWPLQDGQWLPHPAPEPVARTTAPTG